MNSYLQIYGRTREQILNGELKPGARLPAHREMSDQFAVSVATITKAINRLKKEGYVESCRGVGTVVVPPRVASHVVPSQTINVVSYFQQFMQDALSYTVQDVFSGSKWAVNSRCSHSNLQWYRDAIADCRTNPPAGLLLPMMHPLYFSYDDEILPESCTKVVLLNHEIPGRRYDLVRLNAHANGKILAEYLLKRGYRDFVLVSDGKPREVAVDSGVRSLRSTFEREGIAFGPECYRTFDNPHNFGAKLEPFRDSYTYVKEMLQREQPRVIIAGHDWVAVGAIRAVMDSGLSIPGDVAVASMGTAIDLSAITVIPKITSVDMLFEQQIRVAAEVLKARLEGDDGAVVYREFCGQMREGETA